MIFDNQKQNYFQIEVKESDIENEAYCMILYWIKLC